MSLVKTLGLCSFKMESEAKHTAKNLMIYICIAVDWLLLFIPTFVDSIFSIIKILARLNHNNLSFKGSSLLLVYFKQPKIFAGKQAFNINDSIMKNIGAGENWNNNDSQNRVEINRLSEQPLTVDWYQFKL